MIFGELLRLMFVQLSLRSDFLMKFLTWLPNIIHLEPKLKPELSHNGCCMHVNSEYIEFELLALTAALFSSAVSQI